MIDLYQAKTAVFFYTGSCLKGACVAPFKQAVCLESLLPDDCVGAVHLQDQTTHMHLTLTLDPPCPRNVIHFDNQYVFRMIGSTRALLLTPSALVAMPCFSECPSHVGF